MASPDEDPDIDESANPASPTESEDIEAEDPERPRRKRRRATEGDLSPCQMTFKTFAQRGYVAVDFQQFKSLLFSLPVIPITRNCASGNALKTDLEKDARVVRSK